MRRRIRPRGSMEPWLSVRTITVSIGPRALTRSWPRASGTGCSSLASRVGAPLAHDPGALMTPLARPVDFGFPVLRRIHPEVDRVGTSLGAWAADAGLPAAARGCLRQRGRSWMLHRTACLVGAVSVVVGGVAADEHVVEGCFGDGFGLVFGGLLGGLADELVEGVDVAAGALGESSSRSRGQRRPVGAGPAPVGPARQRAGPTALSRPATRMPAACPPARCRPLPPAHRHRSGQDRPRTGRLSGALPFCGRREAREYGAAGDRSPESGVVPTADRLALTAWR